MILLPIGHEQEGTRRLPWVTFGVMALCAFAFFLSGQVGPSETEYDRQEDLAEVFDYFWDHPYLELDPEFRGLISGDDHEVQAMIEAARAMGVAPPTDPEILREEQEALDELTRIALGGLHEHPLFEWGLVPARVSLIGLVSHMFLHAGWLHLIGNMLILYLAGPFVEDVWGRPLYAAFYGLSGIVAALSFVVLFPDLEVPLVGASGAIAGVMGAFLIRFHTTRIRFFYMFGLLFRGTFEAPAWVMLPLWFGQQVFFGLMTHGGSGHGVAYWAHVGGFAFGVGTAFLIKQYRVEERFIEPALDGKIDETVVKNEAVEQALAARDAGRADEAFAMLLAECRRAPGNHDAALALWSLAVEIGRAPEAASCYLGLIQHELRTGETAVAIDRWDELVAVVPQVEVPVPALLRVAKALSGESRDDAARDALRRALLAAGTQPGAIVALRIAGAAVKIDPGISKVAAQLAMAQSDLDPDQRQQAESLLSGGGISVSRP